MSVLYADGTRPTGFAGVLARLEVGDCWTYTGSPAKKRPNVSVGGKQYRSVYRVAWEELVGPVPNGMTLDHLCFNTRCCNPDHMEVVTQGVNTRRGAHRNPVLARQRAQRACIHGHPFNAENTYTDKRGRRHCKTCRRERMRAS